jgi:hypothetical protein
MQEEIFGNRYRAYSAWHRRVSLARFVALERAEILSMNDLDMALYLEYDDKNRPRRSCKRCRTGGKSFSVTQGLPNAPASRLSACSTASASTETPLTLLLRILWSS